MEKEKEKEKQKDKEVKVKIKESGDEKQDDDLQEHWDVVSSNANETMISKSPPAR